MALKFRQLSVPQAKQALRLIKEKKGQTYETDNDITRAGQLATNREDRSVTGAADRWTLRRDSLRPDDGGATPHRQRFPCAAPPAYQPRPGTPARREQDRPARPDAAPGCPPCRFGV